MISNLNEPRSAGEVGAFASVLMGFVILGGGVLVNSVMVTVAGLLLTALGLGFFWLLHWLEG
jgi:hypothetical protein